MNVRLTNYFEKFHILSTREFEFQKGKSCSDAIVRLAEYIYTRETPTFGGIFLALRGSGDFGAHLGNRRLRPR